MTVRPNDIAGIRRVCIHEAGHYIVAKELAFATHGITATFSQQGGHSAYAVIEPWTKNVTTLDEVGNYLARRIKVLFAGAISEAMDAEGRFDPDRPSREWRSGASMSDHDKIRELMQTLRNVKHPFTSDEPTAQVELTCIDTTLIQETAALVHARIELIHHVGNMLLQKVKVYNANYSLAESEIREDKKIQILYNNVKE